MVDRQDIDALLIGSLYGELSSTEEARLMAHLESHPADRTALANLTHAREVIRESRILQVSFDPPQSVSALLIQEAARRAPKPREEASWFQRFMRSFMTHPAMAAAAMLVLIVGVAGTVYMRQGDHFAKQTADNSTDQLASPAAQQAPSATPTTGDTTVAGAPSDDYRVDLNDDESERQAADKVVGAADPAASQAAPPAAPPAEAVDDKKKRKGSETLAFESSDRTREQTAKQDRNFDGALDSSGQKPSVNAPVAKTTTRSAKPSPRLEVTTPGQAPKDFDSVATKKRGLEEKKPDTVASGAGGAATSTPAAPPPPPPVVAASGETQKQEQADPLLAWAKQQHGRVVAAVRAGKCESAASIAVEISNKASAYYTANVESDRTIKPCMQYITAQREKEAERVQRAKSTQRRSVDEAPAPAKSK